MEHTHTHTDTHTLSFIYIYIDLSIIYKQKSLKSKFLFQIIDSIFLNYFKNMKKLKDKTFN